MGFPLVTQKLVVALYISDVIWVTGKSLTRNFDILKCNSYFVIFVNIMSLITKNDMWLNGYLCLRVGYLKLRV